MSKNKELGAARADLSSAQPITDVATILERAADLIAPEGRWMRGGLCGDKAGRRLDGAVTGADFCASSWSLVGALQKAAWLQARDDERERPRFGIISHQGLVPTMALLVSDHLGLKFVDHIIDWNDESGRTQAEVVQALRAAAALAKAQGVQS